MERTEGVVMYEKTEDTYGMLKKAEKHIEDLTIKLKEKESELNDYANRCRFYEQIVKCLTTFR